LLEMAFLDNWLEVSRVTVPLWILFVPILQSTSKSGLRLGVNGAGASRRPHGEQHAPQETEW
jgi:hypothetical protein